VHDGSNFKEAESSHLGNQDSRIVPIDFDKLRYLASNKPEAFERYREELYQQAIEQAPIELQRRLKGVQFRINMARQGARSPLSSCMRLSEMMHDSFVELQLALANPRKYLQEQSSKPAESAEIVELFPK
jgi:hypothetical protein